MQNTLSQSGNDSKCFFKKMIFQNNYVELEAPPPPFMEKSILNFNSDYLTPSLSCLSFFLTNYDEETILCTAGALVLVVVKD